MENRGKNARKVSIDLVKLKFKKRNAVLKKFGIYLKNNSNLILNANKKDLNNAKKLKYAMIERLKLDNKKINQIIKSVSDIIKLKDPLNKTLSSWNRPNGLTIKRISTPIGVIGVIYESRPNVTADVSSLCFKAGSALILKGGSEAFYSNKILSDLFRKALKKMGCNINCVQFIKNKDRSNVDYLLSNMKKYIDVIIPRGGKSLVKKITNKSKIPTIGHLEGLCHVYIDKKADLKMAIKVIENAKMRNPSICGAAETLLIDKACLKTHCEPVLDALSKLGCQIIGDKEIEKNFSKKIKTANENDWSTEYLSAKISVKSVDGIDGAITHINKYGTSHTDSIITKDKKIAEKFFLKINSSIVVHNTSTQFADGGEFGFGAEVGISTNKMHPRGPVGLDQLVSYKYILKGRGQVRK